MKRGIATYADILEIEKAPLEDYHLPQNTYELLRQGVDRNPQKAALKFFLQGTDHEKHESYTYAAFLEAVHQTANMFWDLGIQNDGVVSYILPNLPETFFTYFGGEAAGIVGAINPLLEPQQIADILNASETKVLVTLAPFPKTDLWQKVDSIRKQVPSLKTILTIDLGTHLSGIKKLIVKLVTSTKSIQKVAGQKVLDFHKTLKKYPKHKLDFDREITPDTIASYFHTGGTTGLPKIAQHTHYNEVFNAWSIFRNLERDENWVFFCGLPLFHVNGITVTGLGPFMEGVTVVLGTPQGYRGEGVLPNFWKIVETYKITFFSGVPTVYQYLLSLPLNGENISSLQFAICGAAPMPKNVFNEFQEKSGVKIIEGYGLTEGNCASAINPPSGLKKVGSVGFRIPFQQMDVMMLDENGAFERRAEPDETGVIALKGGNVFPGYKDEQHNQGIWIEVEGENWLNTGDLGYKDTENYFWLTGRKKELIIRGGHNIDPKIIEDPLHLHPSIAFAAAIGKPDVKVGELPVAYVQLKEGEQATEEELMEYATKHITERAAIPKKIYLINEMPLTAIGKIFKPALLSLEIKAVIEMELVNLGIRELAEVNVGRHKTKGQMAHISIVSSTHITKEVEAKISERLGNYSFAYDVVFS
ncbi:acyl-CoA synthetase [Flammeovirgaceae bacterium SG7u.111]|nr:acyl-CoA synthetase [Flammeovirgaceae bacterium SG7u.132]WPO37812.1 acyl-CoA synthetase [Flammeovirgaceae bacterium SG7u.111]